MNKVTVKNIFVLVSVVLLLFCLVVPSYARPMMKGNTRGMQRVGDITSVLDDILPEANITEGETQDGIIGDDVPSTTTKKAVTTTTPVTTTPTTTTVPATAPTTTKAPVSSALNNAVDTARGSGLVVWGVVLAVIIAAAVVAVILMTQRKGRR